MNQREAMDRASARFADSLTHTIARQVERAIALERDRVDAELADLRESIGQVALGVTRVAAMLEAEIQPEARISGPGWSVRVDNATEGEGASDNG